MSSNQRPDWDWFVERAIALTKGDMTVRLPAIVDAFDAVNLRADVRIITQPVRRDPDTDQLVPDQFPPLTSVPVQYPNAGGFVVTWPLTAGDQVWVCPADRSLAEWRSGLDTPQTPASPRRFDLADAVVVPNALRGTPVTSQATASNAYSIHAPVGGEVRLGDAAATDFVALATLIVDALGQLKSVFDNHVHISAAPATPTSIPAVAVGGPDPGTASVFPTFTEAQLGAQSVKAR